MVVKTAFQVSKGKFWGEICFWENPFFNFFGQYAKIFRNLSETMAAWLTKLLSACPKELLEENCFWGNFFLTVLENNENFFAFSSETFWHGFQNCILRVHWNTSGINFWDIICSNFLSLGLWPKILQHYSEFFFGLLAILFRQVCQNCLLFVLKNSLRQCFFLGKNVYVLTLWDTDWKNFGHLSNIFGRGFPKSFLREQRYKLSKKRFSEIFLNHFRIACGILSDLVEKSFDVDFKNTLYESRETLSG